MTTTSAHFRINGEDFTALVRDLFLSEQPDRAWQLITEGLAGGSPGQAEYVAKLLLDGKMKLVGNETVGLTPIEDNAEEYMKEIHYLYSGRVRVGGRWWRPKTKITNFGPDDMPKGGAPVFIGPGREKRQAGLAKIRAEFYCPPDHRVMLDGVIFEPCGEPPHWWKRNSTPDAALKDFLAVGRTLEEDGWHQRFGHLKAPEPVVPDEKAKQERLLAEEEAEEEQRLRQEAMAKHLKEVGVKVREQAGDDLYDLHLKDGTVVKVPRAPFFHWSLRRTTLRHLAPPWNCVARGDEKTRGDDPYHTDWVLGAGFTIEDAYSGPIKEASEKAMDRLQTQLGNFEAGVIVGGEDVVGMIGKDILVLANLHPNRLEAMLKARGVITEAGGRAAHLAQMAMEHCIPIMRVEDAQKKFPKWTRVSMSPSNGKIEILVDHLGGD